jgi:hypothetical protein
MLLVQYVMGTNRWNRPVPIAKQMELWDVADVELQEC